MTPSDQAAWHHLTKAIAAILAGKRQAAITETRKALHLLQS